MELEILFGKYQELQQHLDHEKQINAEQRKLMREKDRLLYEYERRS